MPAAKKPAPPLLTLAEIEAVDDLKTETVEIPEWGGAVVVREWTLEQTLAFATVPAEDDAWTTLVNGLAHPAVNEEGAKALLKKSSPTMQRVIEEINKINGFTDTVGDTGAAEREAEATFLPESPE